jgi:uncharacterized membrane protein YeaQ/YmgE (transglycosylase-associated protein family)
MAGWLTGWLIGWLTAWLGGWLIELVADCLAELLIDCLTTWLNGWLTAWLTGWLTDWLADWLIDWLIGWLADWLTDWLAGWLTDWLAGWLTDWLTDHRVDQPVTVQCQVSTHVNFSLHYVESSTSSIVIPCCRLSTVSDRTSWLARRLPLSSATVQITPSSVTLCLSWSAVGCSRALWTYISCFH